MKKQYAISGKSVLLWVAAVMAAIMCGNIIWMMATEQYAQYKEYWGMAIGSGLLALFPLCALKLRGHAGWMMLIPVGLLTIAGCFSAPETIASWMLFVLFLMLVIMMALRMKEGIALVIKVLAVFMVLFGLLSIILPMWQRVYDWSAAGRLSYEGSNTFVARYFFRGICQRGISLCSVGCLILGMKPVRHVNRLEDEQDQFDRIWE